MSLIVILLKSTSLLLNQTIFSACHDCIWKLLFVILNHHFLICIQLVRSKQYVSFFFHSSLSPVMSSLHPFIHISPFTQIIHTFFGRPLLACQSTFMFITFFVVCPLFFVRMIILKGKKIIHTRFVSVFSASSVHHRIISSVSL